MKKILRTIASILILPATVLVLIPSALVQVSNDICYAWMCAFPFNIIRLSFAILVMGAGLALFVWTNVLYFRSGDGTLAPWDPVRTLIIKGPYRYIRHPMIAGVLLMLLGESVLLTSIPVFIWFAVFFLLNVFYLPFSEERGLRKRYGEAYARYQENVPAWIPREEPWEGEDTRQEHPHF
ncbi:MAG: isoprenylcysteine carboxylmethyltransferase family protein [Anaerolineales bacterium]|nr:isoprenylcysteine carboxylmethyltransferase family protein [Anaerolineales bacterium]